MRPHPFTLVFDTLAEAHFPAIRDAVGNTPSLDQFLLAEATVELLQALRPEEGIGDAMDDFVAFSHAAFRYWAAGAITQEIELSATRALCIGDEVPPHSAPTVAQYIQVSPRLIWAQLGEDTLHEPLDGWFLFPEGDGVRLVACFGVHAERPGLSVVSVAGSAPGRVARPDGTPLFGPTMTGGEVAGLHAVASPEELLLLAWRAGWSLGDH